VARRNVTRHPPRIGRKFIPVSTQSRILPGDGNYRYYLNAGIMAGDHGWHRGTPQARVRPRPAHYGPGLAGGPSPREAVVSVGVQARELRVMIVTDQYEPMVGGVPTVTRELASGLAERGHAVVVLAPSPARPGAAPPAGGDPVAAGQATENGVAVDRRGSLPWPWYPGQRLGLLPPRRARELMERFAPDVVHVHSPLTLGAAARPAARRAGVPVVYTNHYLPLNVWPAAARDPRHPGGARAARSRARDAAFYAVVTGFANRCDHVTAPTVTAVRLLREHGLRVPSEPVSNGVDLARFTPGPPDEALRARLGLPAGRPVVLSVGRLSPEKRPDVLIAALARLEAAAPGAGGPLLVLAGTGPDEGRLRSLARHHGVAERVRFPGFVPEADLPGLYRLADVFAIASEAELQSLATMAAMASGLPVVAADAGALGELVHPGENGFLFRPGRPGELAGRLAVLGRDAALRARMARASGRIIADHDRHRVLARWESLYCALRGAGPGAMIAAAGPARGAAATNESKVSDGQP
jgi:glycosyltransferase involved in cell wall biosynthesis